MEKVEEDLLRSKALRENQTKEFSRQLDALREKYDEQVCCVCVSVCVVYPVISLGHELGKHIVPLVQWEVWRPSPLPR